MVVGQEDVELLKDNDLAALCASVCRDESCHARAHMQVLVTVRVSKTRIRRSLDKPGL